MDIRAQASLTVMSDTTLGWSALNLETLDFIARLYLTVPLETTFDAQDSPQFFSRNQCTIWYNGDIEGRQRLSNTVDDKPW